MERGVVAMADVNPGDLISELEVLVTEELQVGPAGGVGAVPRT